MTATANSTRCLYVFGITYAADTEAIPVPQKVERTRVGGVAAVHHTIDAADLAGIDDDLSEHSRLAAVARTHDSVVRALHDAGTVLPVRLGTVFADSDELRDVLARHQEELTTALSQVRGQDEWRVRLAQTEATTDATRSAPTRPATGADYLRARRTSRDEAQRRREALDSAWEALDATLSALAVANANTGTRGTRAYLVPRTRREAFAAAAAEASTTIDDLGAALTMLGPLPPYAFVDAHLGSES